jgi:hypothetical protein
VALPIMIIGGIGILAFLIHDPVHQTDPQYQDVWRAGHAQASLLLIMALMLLPHLDEARLSASWRSVARCSVPTAAVLLPVAYLFSVTTPPNESSRFVYLAYAGALILAVGLITQGIGLLRRGQEKRRYVYVKPRTMP